MSDAGINLGWVREVRTTNPAAIGAAAAARRRRPVLGAAAAARRRRPVLGADGRLMLVAADHPARGAVGVRAQPEAMQDREDLLRRLVVALRRPGVDGVLGSADVLEDLLLGALEDKVFIGSMNRGGLQGAVFEMDDRFTGYDAAGIEAMGFNGGKMLTRVDLADAGTVTTLEACARALNDLALREEDGEVAAAVDKAVDLVRAPAGARS
jgi:hypothetical protein